MCEGSVILLAADFIFQIPFTGSLLALYFSMFVFVTSIVGVGLFISSLCSTQQQAILGSFVFISPSVSLSGFATPIENMPVWLQQMTAVIPLRYFLVIAKGTFLKSMPWHIVLSNTWQMALIGCFTLSLATWLFRRRLE
jgi:ABC-2 type transport system permease protein